jgi:hypothetical protein
MAALNDQPWAEFADRLAQELLEHGATEAAIVTRNENEDRVVTNYFNCNYEQRWLLLGHLFADIIMEVIDINIDEIREMLEREDDDDDPD